MKNILLLDTFQVLNNNMWLMATILVIKDIGQFHDSGTLCEA